MFTMDKLGMDAEVLDICDSMDTKTDVHNYYMSEALLRMKFHDKYYTEVLEGANIIDSNEDMSACQIT